MVKDLKKFEIFIENKFLKTMFDINYKFIKKLALVDTDGEKLTYDDLLVRKLYKKKIKKTV